VNDELRKIREAIKFDLRQRDAERTMTSSKREGYKAIAPIAKCTGPCCIEAPVEACRLPCCVPVVPKQGRRALSMPDPSLPIERQPLRVPPKMRPVADPWAAYVADDVWIARQMAMRDASPELYRKKDTFEQGYWEPSTSGFAGGAVNIWRLR
jgi:hypothetical protein